MENINDFRFLSNGSFYSVGSGVLQIEPTDPFVYTTYYYSGSICNNSNDIKYLDKIRYLKSIAGNDSVLVTVGSNDGVMYFDGNWEYANLEYPPIFSKIYNVNEQLLAVSGDTVFSSINGLNWKKECVQKNTFTSMINAGSRFYATQIHNDTYQILASKDLLTWEEKFSLNSDSTLSEFNIYGTDTSLLCGTFIKNNQWGKKIKQFFYSTNGDEWSEKPIPVDSNELKIYSGYSGWWFDFTDIKYCPSPTLFYMATTHDCYLYTPKEDNIQKSNLPFRDPIGGATTINFVKGTFLSCGYELDGRFLRASFNTSTDGRLWTFGGILPGSGSSSRFLTSIDSLAIIETDGPILTSIDCKNWETLSNSQLSPNHRFTDAVKMESSIIFYGHNMANEKIYYGYKTTLPSDKASIVIAVPKGAPGFTSIRKNVNLKYNKKSTPPDISVNAKRGRISVITTYSGKILLKIYDLKGRVLVTGMCSTTQGKLTDTGIQSSMLSSGFYILQIATDDGYTAGKIFNHIK